MEGFSNKNGVFTGCFCVYCYSPEASELAVFVFGIETADVGGCPIVFCLSFCLPCFDIRIRPGTVI